jgi:hypothetical protein
VLTKKKVMETSKTKSIVEAESNDPITRYFERARSFGVIAVMTLFYTALFAIFSLA